MTYETALGELESILLQLQEGQVSIDELSSKVARAEALIAWCKQNLRTVEGQLEQLARTNDNTPTDV